MDFDTLFPNRFMKAGEFNGKDVTYKIASVITEELEGQKGKQVKGIVSLDGSPKQWVLNKTNGVCLKAMFGRETADWIGKRVTLFPATVPDVSTGEMTLAIRVRGSPDLGDAVREFTAQLGKKKAIFKLLRTGKPAAAPRAAGEKKPNHIWDRIVKMWKRDEMEWHTFCEIVKQATGKPKEALDENDIALVQVALQGEEPPMDAPPPDAAEVQHG